MIQIQAFFLQESKLATRSHSQQRLPMVRASKGQAFYSLSTLIRCMEVRLGFCLSQSAVSPRTRNLRRVQKLQVTAAAVLKLLDGDDSRGLAPPVMPHEATLSRAKCKLDVACMFLRRQHWEKELHRSSIQLGTLEWCLPFRCRL